MCNVQHRNQRRNAITVILAGAFQIQQHSVKSHIGKVKYCSRETANRMEFICNHGYLTKHFYSPATFISVGLQYSGG